MPQDTPPPVAPPPFRRTDRSLPIALLRAREVVMAPIREMLAASGVNEQKWRVLRVLHERGPMELTALAQEACLLLPSLTRIFRAMEEEGLVSRQTPARDRRKTIAALSDKGLSVIHAHAAESAALFARLEAGFGPERMETLLDLLEDLRHMPPPDRKAAP